MTSAARWRPGHLLLLLPILLILFFVSRSNRHSESMQTPATNFRHYLAEGNAHLVVYAPDLDLRNSAQVDTMRQQLAILRSKFDGLVLYNCDGDTATILAAAQRLGYRAVLLTIWNPKSAQEIRIAAELVQSYRGSMALAVSIGSEGLMEGRYEIGDLHAANKRLQRSLSHAGPVEITTAEPWWLYLRDSPESTALISFGDFLSTNIHVIWDTDITDPAEAARWTAERAIELQHTAGNHEVLIRESGFPGGGNSPRESIHFGYTRQAQATFWTTLLKRPKGDPIPTVVAFEGVDNRAKHWHDFESTWGLISPEMQTHPAWDSFPTTGPQLR
jgi:exo-beta-1,3-glucanase (GH17 family)